MCRWAGPVSCMHRWEGPVSCTWRWEEPVSCMCRWEGRQDICGGDGRGEWSYQLHQLKDMVPVGMANISFESVLEVV